MTSLAAQFAITSSMIYIAPGPMPTVPTIPPGTFSMGFNPDVPGGFYLRPIDNFTLPAKIYGHNTEYAAVILETFLERTGSITSAALSGQKGSGKTLTAKEIAIKALELGIPTIEISSAFSGAGFNAWLQQIRQPVVVFIDEFEKVYKDEDDRNRLLSLLDGTFKTHKLFLFTMNKKLDQNNFEYFFNRPGRVYYNIPYGAVTPEIVREYCADHLADQTRTAEVVSFSKRFSYFTLDILTILVKEINKWPSKTCQDISHIVNIKPDVEPGQLTFTVEIFDPTGKKLETALSEFSWKDNPDSPYVPYDFVRQVLSGNSRPISFPFYTKAEFEKAKELYEKDNTNYDYTLSFDEQDELDDTDQTDEAAMKLFKDRVATYRRGKNHRGQMQYRFSLDSKSCVAEQDDMTRAVTITNNVHGYKIVISPVGLKEAPLRFAF